MCSGNVSINEICNGFVLDSVFDLFLKKDEISDILDSEDISQQVYPELLGFALLVPVPLPVPDKLLSRFRLFC